MVRSRHVAVRVLAMLACCAVLGITVLHVQVAGNTARAQARARGASLAKAVADQASDVLSLADVMLGMLADLAQEGRASEQLLARVQRSAVARAGSAHVQALAAYSADGWLLAATPIAIGLPAHLTAGELGFYQSHPDGALLLEEFEHLGGMNRGEIAVSRRFDAADALPGGVLLVLMDPESFGDFYSSLQVGARGAIGLIRQGGGILARGSGVDGEAGESAALLGYRRHNIANSYDAVSPVDGRRWFASLRAVDGFPLVAFVALNEADVLTYWRSDARFAVLAACALCLGIGTFGWVLAGKIKLAEEQLQTSNVLLQRTAMQDPLTGIGNRRLFDETLQREQRRAARAEQPLALLMIDVDYFKLYNDTYGHQAGDYCLRAVAGAIAQLTRRPGDLAARFGGEEFVVLLPDTEATGALTLAERAQSSVRQLHIPHQGGVDGIVTISVGVAVVWPQPVGDSGVDLVGLADAALYAAKAQGRDRCCVSPPSAPLEDQDELTAWRNLPGQRSSATQ